VLGPTAPALRRRAGPVGWTTLEALVAGAAPEPAGWTCPTNVRRLAAELGLSKDTVARALVRLATAGLVLRREHRSAEHGTFAGSSYVLGPEVVEALVVPPPAAPSRPIRQPKSRLIDPPVQPDLFTATAEARP